MGLFSKLLKPGADKHASTDTSTAVLDAPEDDGEIFLGGASATAPKPAAEPRDADKRRHPRVVQTSSGGAYGKPRFWVFGGRDCYEDPNDETATLNLDEAKARAAMPRPDMEGKVELPRYLKKRESGKS